MVTPARNTQSGRGGRGVGELVCKNRDEKGKRSWGKPSMRAGSGSM